MGSDEEREPDSYQVEVSDTADAEADKVFIWLAGRSPVAAGRWYQGLLEAYQSLSRFPSRCPLAPENDAFPEVEVRQLMYGTGRSAYRILFFIRERMEHDSPVVRILHVRHGSQQPLGQHRIGNDEDDTTG
jgi:plasmid stabilization system protein ParE